MGIIVSLDFLGIKGDGAGECLGLQKNIACFYFAVAAFVFFFYIIIADGDMPGQGLEHLHDPDLTAHAFFEITRDAFKDMGEDGLIKFVVVSALGLKEGHGLNKGNDFAVSGLDAFAVCFLKEHHACPGLGLHIKEGHDPIDICAVHEDGLVAGVHIF